MKRILSRWAILTICLWAAVIDISAQQTGPAQRISSQIKIESFDWYLQSDGGKTRTLKNYYGRNLPEGKSANIPTDNSSPTGKAEKFIYRIRIRNLSDKEISSVVWRYQFFNPITGELVASLEFESRARIKPNKRKMLDAETVSPPARVVDARLLRLNPKQPFKESAAVESLAFARTFGVEFPARADRTFFYTAEFEVK
jgi:hypothetical protein